MTSPHTAGAEAAPAAPADAGGMPPHSQNVGEQWAERFTIGIACAMLLLMTALSLVDVVGRDLFNQPVPGATELIEMLLAGMTFLVYPHVAWRGLHITVDLFNWFSAPRPKRVLQVIHGLLGMCIFGGLAWRLGVQASRVAAYGDASAQLKIPMSWPLWFMALMSACTAVVYALTCVLGSNRTPGATQAPERARPLE